MSDREAALARLDEITRRLRRECPWDREQDERSIVPHTVEEAYELADAARSRDDAKLLDELGDVLFQVYFLALLMEERGAGSLAEVAEHCSEKLVRRHPHVFGSAAAETAAEVLHTWDQAKRTEEGRGRAIFEEVPENLPALLHARKLQRRAATSGFDWEGAAPALAKLGEELGEVEAAIAEDEAAPVAAAGDRAAHGSDRLYDEVGDLLFAAVGLARKLRVDPELALRGSSARFRDRVERAEALAEAAGERWGELGPEAQLAWYERARRVGNGADGE